MKKQYWNKGFTLAELLIVVAIIGVLVSISIPIFSVQLEKAREATDAANIRSQYAEIMADAIMDGGAVNKNHSTYEPIRLQQQKNEWQSTGLKTNLEGVFGDVVGEYPKAGGQAWVEYSASKNYSILHYEDGSGDTGGSGSGSGGSETTPTNPTTPTTPSNPDPTSKPDPSEPGKRPITGDSSDSESSGETGNSGGSSNNTIQSFSYKEWPTTIDFSNNKNVTTTLTTGELFTYKGKHYISLQDKTYIENQWYQDNPDNANNAKSLVCIDDSKILSELDGKYLVDWKKFAIYMNYGEIYKTRTGDYYFYKGDPCYQNCPEETAASDCWIKLKQ